MPVKPTLVGLVNAGLLARAVDRDLGASPLAIEEDLLDHVGGGCVERSVEVCLAECDGGGGGPDSGKELFGDGVC